MTAADPLPIYEELLDILADTADLNRLLTFRLPADRQVRLDELLQKIETDCLPSPKAANWRNSSVSNISGAC